MFAVIEIVKESFGLFLKHKGDALIVVDDSAAQLKVSTLFRSLPRGKRTKKASLFKPGVVISFNSP